MIRFREFINESSMGRVFQHTQNRNIGIITANRGEHTADENIARNRELESDIKKSGHGFIHVKGRYIENKGTPKEKAIDTEHSYLVVGKKGKDSGSLKGFLLKHGQKYNQDSVLYKPHDTADAHWLHTKDTEEKKIGDTTDQGPFHPRKIGDYHSKLMSNKNAAFTFAHTNESLVDGVEIDYVFLVPVSPAQFGNGEEKEF